MALKPLTSPGFWLVILAIVAVALFAAALYELGLSVASATLTT